MNLRTYSPLASELVRQSLGIEQRDSVVRSNAGPRQRMKFEEVAGGVEAPADARGSGAHSRGTEARENPTPSDELTDADMPASAPATAPASIQAREVLGGRLRLVIDNMDMGSVPRRHRGPPTPALPRPMLLIVAGGGGAPGDVQGRVHDASEAS